MYDAIVVGGGILGASTAYHLLDRGQSVLLVDRADEGRATDAGAGIISPPTSERTGAAWNDFAIAAERYYPGLVERLRAEQDGPVGYARCGKLTVVPEGQDDAPFHDALEGIYAQRDRLDYPAPATLQTLSPEAARERIPMLGPVRETLLYADAARMDGRVFTQAVLAAARAAGLEERGASVETIELDDGPPRAVVDGEPIAAGTLVIAGGAWSPALAAALDVELPVAPMRGQLLHLDVDAETGTWPIVDEYGGHYVVPWPDGRIVVGATHEAGSGFSPTPTVAGVHRVLESAMRLLPGLADARLSEIRVGLRPATPDDRPVIGPVPGREDVVLATGHGGHGLQLGPYTGRVVADLVVDGTTDADLSAFDVARFQ